MSRGVESFGGSLNAPRSSHTGTRTASPTSLLPPPPPSPAPPAPPAAALPLVLLLVAAGCSPASQFVTSPLLGRLLTVFQATTAASTAAMLPCAAGAEAREKRRGCSRGAASSSLSRGGAAEGKSCRTSSRLRRSFWLYLCTRVFVFWCWSWWVAAVAVGGFVGKRVARHSAHSRAPTCTRHQHANKPTHSSHVGPPQSTQAPAPVEVVPALSCSKVLQALPVQLIGTEVTQHLKQAAAGRAA